MPVTMAAGAVVCGRAGHSEPLCQAPVTYVYLNATVRVCARVGISWMCVVL